MREAQFHTMPSEQCVAFITRPQVDPYTVICAEANYTNGQSIHMGDSGISLLIHFDSIPVKDKSSYNK